MLASRSLPAGLGWASVVLGVLSVAGPVGFIAFLLFPVWVLVVAVTLYRGTTAPVTGTTSAV